jgi:hypothetical protein
MNTRTSVAAVLVVTAIGASIAGCGGGSKGLSKADLDTKANAICKTGGDKIKAVPAPSTTDIQDATKAAAYFDKIVPIAQDATNQLAALKPADDVKADWDAFIIAQKNATALLVSIQHKADVKDRSGLSDLTKYPALDQAVNTAADKVGATGCNDGQGG